MRGGALSSNISMGGVRVVSLFKEPFIELIDEVIDELDAMPVAPPPPARCSCMDPEHALALREAALRTAPHTPIPHLRGCAFAKDE